MSKIEALTPAHLWEKIEVKSLNPDKSHRRQLKISNRILGILIYDSCFPFVVKIVPTFRTINGKVIYYKIKPKLTLMR
jgi:hypothetical protein